MFETRLTRIVQPKREKVTGGWRKPYKEEHHNMYSPPDIIRAINSRMTTWTGHVACIRDEKFVQNFSLIPDGKRQLGRPRHRWKKMSNWILK